MPLWKSKKFHFSIRTSIELALNCEILCSQINYCDLALQIRKSWPSAKNSKSSNWHSLITFRYSSSAACILRRRRVHFFQSWLSLPLGYTCGVHWGSETEGGIGFEPCWYWNCSSWYQFIVFNFKPWAWTANKFANLHFSSTLFSREKTIWHRKVCSSMFFFSTV